ncbi:MAG TPA: acyl-CoA dehydrogenase family protein [Oligoflexus sp.]|uniref:acyl-CoA dehydrogenase family protein n=1 Tax=Oligoflexus sp. TaxID=1971216 RepID=UPI002D3BA185|nr:acyl-CoA dehydrogenase family protein [Oligoflexus sp.]HYX37639.1 acyl-CoA dehydrogenase family protein [Oligoflexus sp.]
MQQAMFAHYYDESHRTFRDSCRRFVDKEIRPYAFEWEEAEIFDADLYPKAAALGLLGPTFPVEYGGGGGDLFHAIVAQEELLRGGATGVAVGLVGSLSIALPPILALGTDAQKKAFVPAVLRGEKIAALAITEPDTGSDVARITTTARPVADGYVIKGAKTFITSGVRAHQFTVLARTADTGHKGLTFFVVEKERSGFRISKNLKKTGWRSSDTAELVFDDVFVPSENRLGPEGSGFAAIMKNFENERLMLAVQGYALAEIAMEEALHYSLERQAFGQPIARFQVTRHKLADMQTKILGAKALTLAVARQMQDGKESPQDVAAAKNLAATVAQEVCYEAVQIFGGMGYMRETLVERIARDARLLPIGGGTQEIMKEIIAKGLNL